MKDANTTTTFELTPQQRQDTVTKFWCYACKYKVLLGRQCK
ncbi:hypothetical protein E2C01_021598 [Portunus trituberculatus]|uniref:Uncharacterized protein n=1 Tax=Portunus trituberculatus TaxID=210409 RepID=A0A5B7E6J0_PORTR|nr:hypothetical protein [Portunus trituberculatus]